LRVSVERGSSGNQPFSVGAALVAARTAGVWGGEERGGRGQAPPIRVSIERGSSGNQPFSVGAALVAARLAGAWDGNERGGRVWAPAPTCER
ncbi:hypothetical protein, partial [Flavonifractor plautii]|uniref:hypothetical protein n=1 Tax=Flavonifractor plautii TaxID=292800 RepID=UPI003D7C5D8F